MKSVRRTNHYYLQIGRNESKLCRKTPLGSTLCPQGFQCDWTRVLVLMDQKLAKMWFFLEVSEVKILEGYCSFNTAKKVGSCSNLYGWSGSGHRWGSISSESYRDFRLRMRKCKIAKTLITFINNCCTRLKFSEARLSQWGTWMCCEKNVGQLFSGHAQVQNRFKFLTFSCLSYGT